MEAVCRLETEGDGIGVTDNVCESDITIEVV